MLIIGETVALQIAVQEWHIKMKRVPPKTLERIYNFDEAQTNSNYEPS